MASIPFCLLLRVLVVSTDGVPQVLGIRTQPRAWIWVCGARLVVVPMGSLSALRRPPWPRSWSPCACVLGASLARLDFFSASLWGLTGASHLGWGGRRPLGRRAESCSALRLLRLRSCALLMSHHARCHRSLVSTHKPKLGLRGVG